MSKLTKAECRRRALLAADWFVNTQVIQHSPQWDANHGRVIYNRHLPSGRTVLGLAWSQGRAIMCLVDAWRLTHKQAYLDSAIACGDYLRYALQCTDPRNPRSFGAFREEVPTSPFSYPRDGIEGAFGLLLLHLATGERDWLERCVLFAEWFLEFAYDRRERQVRNRVDFQPSGRPEEYSYIHGGGAPFFWHLFQLTGEPRYRRMVFALADGLMRRFIDADTGAIRPDTVGLHHSGMLAGKPVVFNDDGAPIALTCAHVATGKKTSKYLDAAVRYGRWMARDLPKPAGKFAARGIEAIFLTELAALTGDTQYADVAREWAAEPVKFQFITPGRPDRHGGYRGEDEPAEWYFKGAAPSQFVTTRTTAYSTLALLRASGLCHGPSYSALGLKDMRAACKRK